MGIRRLRQRSARARRGISPRVQQMECRILLSHDLANLSLRHDFLDLHSGTINAAPPRDQLTALVAGGPLVARLDTTAANPQVAEIRAIYKAYLHERPSPADLRRALHFLARGGELEQVEAQVLGSADYFRERARRRQARFLTVLAQDVLHHPLDAGRVQQYTSLLAQHTSRATIATLVLRQRDAERLISHPTPTPTPSPTSSPTSTPTPTPPPPPPPAPPPPASSSIVLTEGNGFVSEARELVDLGQTSGSRQLTFTVSAQFDPTPAGAAIGDQFLVYLVDPNQPSHTLLDRGQSGTALFTLAGSTADYVPGLVQYDGTTVTLDVTSLAKLSQGMLVFQLLGSDSAKGSVVHIGAVSDTVDPAGQAGTVFPQSQATAPAGAAIALSGLSAASDLQPLVSDVRFDDGTDLYTAQLRLRDDGAATGRQVAVVFKGLPSGVQLQDASGEDASGNPYISFAEAIPDGGLGTGTLSDPIQVTFSDPGQVRFALVPQVLSAGPDAGPVFTPVGPLSVMPGGYLKVALQATDPDGDPVHFSLSSSGPLPTANLQSDGTLVFTPTPSEVGTYNLTLGASDGAQQTTQDVTLTVAPDPVTTTRLSGVVLDDAGRPLAGVPVDVEFLPESTVTGSDGSFLLDLGTGTLPSSVILEVHGEELGGPTTYPFVAADQSLLLGNGVYPGVDNVIGRPVILTPVDTAHAVTVDPTKAMTVSSTSLPGASLSITAFSVTNPDGSYFKGALGLTEVPLASTPVALPANLHPDLAVMVAPARLRITPSDAVLQLPNQAGWPAGTTFQLWTLDSFAGQLRQVGTGTLSPDGTAIQGTSNSLTAGGGLYFFVPVPQAASSLSTNPLNPLPGLPASPASTSFGSDISLYSGAVQTSDDLVTYQSQGVVRGLQLDYNSLWADPRPIVHFGYQNLPAGSANDSLTASLSTVAGLPVAAGSAGPGTVTTGAAGAVAEFGMPSGENYWKLPAGGGPIDVALQADLSSQRTGVYNLELSVGLTRFVPGTNDVTGGFSSESMPVVSVNTSDSAFGSGWSLGGLQQVVENSDQSLLLVDGDGTTLLFEPPTTPGGPYVDPAGDFSTLVELADGTFQRTLTDQTVYHFNAQGQLASTRDRNGNQTQYLYDVAGRLTTIVDPVGLRTTFSYTGNLVTGITDPDQRTTVLKYDGAGNLVAVINPDQSERQWAYDANHLLTVDTDQRGNRDQDFYDFAGRGVSSLRSDGSTVQVSPAEVNGLYPPAQTAAPVNATFPTAGAPAQAVVQIADPNGNVTTEMLDQRGQEESSADAVGTLGSVTRNSLGLIVQSTNGLGNQTSDAYDAKGNLINTQDSLAGAFLGQSDYSLGSTSIQGRGGLAVAVGDVNGDGAPDLIAISGLGSNEPTGQILLNVKNGAGQATGTFAPGPTVPEIDGGVTDLAMGDFNGDGKLDLLTGGGGLGLGVRLGNGDGTFGNPAYYPAGVSSMVVADFTGNGRDDVAVADITSGSVSVRLANPNGTLGSATNYGAGTGPELLASADINGDGVPDLVTVDVLSNLIVLLGNKNPATGKGDGTFTAGMPIAIPNTTGIAFGDLNEDGHLDIITTGEVLLNNGNGTFTAVSHPEIQGAPTIADVDGDHHLDVIFQSTTSTAQGVAAYTNVLYGKGDGTFGGQMKEAINFQGGAPVLSDVVADLNGDGRPDLVVAISPALSIDDAAILLNAGVHPAGNGPLGGRSFTYDPTFNEVTSATDELGRQTLYQIDPSNGNVLAESVVVGNGAPNLVTRYTYFPDGEAETVTDPLGRITAFSYDTDGRLETQTVAMGTPDQAVTTYKYDGAGNISAVIDPDNNRTDYQYDSMNRLILTRDALGHDTQITYDAFGNVLTLTDAAGNVTTNTYDSFNRLMQTTAPDPDGPGPLAAPVTNYRYDSAGNLAKMIDPLEHVTTYGYDARGRLTSVTDAQGGITTYGYDLDNNRTSITDADGNLTQFAYDRRNRLVGETDPLGNTITLQYDPVNNVESRTDRDGRTITDTYNVQGEPLDETWIGAGGATDNEILYAYDGDGNLLSVTDDSSAFEYTYTGRNQVATVDNSGTPNAPHVVLAYTYDPAGNVLAMTDRISGQADMTDSYTTDALNLVAQITQGGSGVAGKSVEITYNQVGEPATIDRFADVAGTQEVAQSAYTYDDLDRLTDLADSDGATPVTNYLYTFDGDSRVSQVTDGDGTTDYTYDNIDQLLAADHNTPANPAETYTYDSNGNRVTSGTQATTDQIGTDNRVASDGTYTYTYDKEGNLTQQKEIATNNVRIFQWDLRNRLTAVIDKDAAGHVTQEVLFTYDVFNDRIALEVKRGGSDVATDFILDRGNPLLDFVDPDGAAGPDAPAVAMRYLSGPAVDEVFAQEDASGRVSWLLTDDLGSVRDLVDNTGAVVDHITYDSYGNVVAQTHPTVATRFLFAGQQFDVDTGLYYDRARYYDSEQGRFLNEDPAGFGAGTNLYRYVHNSPASRVDPSGKGEGDDEELFQFGEPYDEGDDPLLNFQEETKTIIGPNPLLQNAQQAIENIADAEKTIPQVYNYTQFGEASLPPANNSFRQLGVTFGDELTTEVASVPQGIGLEAPNLAESLAVESEATLPAATEGLAGVQPEVAAAEEVTEVVPLVESEFADRSSWLGPLAGFVAFASQTIDYIVAAASVAASDAAANVGSALVAAAPAGAGILAGVAVFFADESSAY